MALPDEFSAEEIRAALLLTRRAADAQFGLAYDLVTRLPAVHAAMYGGVPDFGLDRSAVPGSRWCCATSCYLARRD